MAASPQEDIAVLSCRVKPLSVKPVVKGTPLVYQGIGYIFQVRHVIHGKVTSQTPAEDAADGFGSEKVVAHWVTVQDCLVPQTDHGVNSGHERQGQREEEEDENRLGQRRHDRQDLLPAVVCKCTSGERETPLCSLSSLLSLTHSHDR